MKLHSIKGCSLFKIDLPPLSRYYVALLDVWLLLDDHNMIYNFYVTEHECTTTHSTVHGR